MIESYKLPTSVISFSEMMESMRRGASGEKEQSIDTPDYFISTSCSTFFKPIARHRLPVRMDFVYFGIVKQGWSELVLNFHGYRCSPGDLIFVNLGAVLDSGECDENTVVEGFMLREEYVKQIYGGNLPGLFTKSSQCFHARLTDEERQTCESYLKTLYNVVRLSQGADHATISTLFMSAINLVQTLFDKQAMPVREYWPRNKRITEAFTQLVSEYVRTEHDVSFYASRLCLSPHRLSVAVKEKTGNTAKAWIDKTLTIEIQIELRHSDKSLKQLADEFRFSSLSAFCKFFKRNTGMTANGYRVKMLGNAL